METIQVLRCMAVLALFAVGCSQRTTLSDGRFVVGVDADCPPFCFRSGGAFTGFDIELARAVCENRGWKFVATPIAWREMRRSLESGEIDCIWSGFTIEGHGEEYVWSNAYLDRGKVPDPSGEAVTNRTCGIAFRLGNEELRDQVDEVLQDLADDGTMKILAGKYGIDESALILWRK